MQAVNTEVKELVIDADRIYRYYCKLSSKYAEANRRLMFAIAFVSVGAVVSVFAAPDYSWIAAVLSIAAALLATAVPLFDFSRRAGVAASIANSCMDITDDVRGLVEKSRLVSTIEIQKDVDALTRRLTRATAPAALQDGFDDEKLSRQAYKEAQRSWESRYVRTA